MGALLSSALGFPLRCPLPDFLSRTDKGYALSAGCADHDALDNRCIDDPVSFPANDKVGPEPAADIPLLDMNIGRSQSPQYLRTLQISPDQFSAGVVVVDGSKSQYRGRIGAPDAEGCFQLQGAFAGLKGVDKAGSSRVLVEWLVDRAEELVLTHTEQAAERAIAGLCRRARAIACFVRLWCPDRAYCPASPLAVPARFHLPLPDPPPDALEVLPPERLILAPDCGMKYLPRERAYGKLKAMVAGARLVRQELGL